MGVLYSARLYLLCYTIIHMNITYIICSIPYTIQSLLLPSAQNMPLTNYCHSAAFNKQVMFELSALQAVNWQFLMFD